MERNLHRPEADIACAMRYALAPQRVEGGGLVALGSWESYGKEELRPAQQEGFLLDRGVYLIQFSAETRSAGAAVTLNGARLVYLEAAPEARRRRVTLQGIVRLDAPGTLAVRNNGEGEGVFSGAVLTALKL